MICIYQLVDEDDDVVLKHDDETDEVHETSIIVIEV